MALDRCLSTGNGDIARIEGDRPVPQRVDLKARKEDPGTKGGAELHSASSEYLVPYRQGQMLLFQLAASRLMLASFFHLDWPGYGKRLPY